METSGTSQGYAARDFAAALFRQSRTVIMCFVFAAVALVTAVLLGPEVYESNLKMLVKRDRADLQVSGAAQSGASTSGDVSEAELNSEVELIQGRDLLEQVAVEAGLVQDDGAGSSNPERARAIAGDALRSDLNVTPIRRSWVIDITYPSKDPAQAKKVLDTLARLYLEKHLAVRRPPGAYEFFSSQTAQFRQELSTAQQKLQEFAERTGAVSAAAQKDAALLRLAEFEALQRQTETLLAETIHRLKALQQEVSSTPARRVTAERIGEAGDLVHDLQGRMLTLQLKRSDLSQKFTADYRLVKEIDQQLAQVRAALDEAKTTRVKEETVEGNPTMQWLEQELARLRTERAALETRAGELRATVATYRARAQQLDAEEAEQKDLLRAVKLAEENHLLYQRKQEEARISDALDRTRIANVAIAQAPTMPFAPRQSGRLLLLIACVLIALVLSIVVGFTKDALTSSIRTPDELQNAIDVPGIAWLPAAR